MDQNADHFGVFFTWIKMPTILGGSSHGSKCRLRFQRFQFRRFRFPWSRFRAVPFPDGSNSGRFRFQTVRWDTNGSDGSGSYGSGFRFTVPFAAFLKIDAAMSIEQIPCPKSIYHVTAYPISQDHIPCLKSRHMSPEHTYRVHRHQTRPKSKKMKILTFSRD